MSDLILAIGLAPFFISLGLGEAYSTALNLPARGGAFRMLRQNAYPFGDSIYVHPRAAKTDHYGAV